jgi:hypothetical protein
MFFGRYTGISWVVDFEIVPVYAWAGSATLGDTCGWSSKFAPFDKDGIVKHYDNSSKNRKAP